MIFKITISLLSCAFLAELQYPKTIGEGNEYNYEKFSYCTNKNKYTDSELLAIRNGFEKRVQNVFQTEMGKPFKKVEILPPLEKGRADFSRNYSYSLVEYATSCLLTNQKIDTANILLLENANYYLKNPRSIYDRDNYHWHSENLLRLIELFGRNGSKHRGLLSTETEDAIMEASWLYCKRKPEEQTTFNQMSKADDDQSNTWYIAESENHHVQSFSTQWHFAKLAKDRPNFQNRVYDDGKKAIDHYKAWNIYIKKYLSERAKKGMFVEMMSIGYNQVLLKGIFNFYDFAEDSDLRKETGQYLDLYFAYWGQEQIDGVSGGGKSRIYVDLAPEQSELGYYFFGIGKPKSLRCELISAMTTNYRPPLVIIDIAKDVQGRGVYEVLQRPLGLAEPGYYKTPIYRMRTDSGGIARYSYCTPDFMMGTAMSMARPESDWAAISTQNRSNGIVFSGNKNAGILPECEIEKKGIRAYNTLWSVESKGTMVCQKNKYNERATNMRVWFASEGLSTPIEENGWVFVESKGAYAALKVADGLFEWKNPITGNKGRWLYCSNQYSPVILQVDQKVKYGSFEEFRKHVEETRITNTNGVLRFKGIYGDDFTFFTDFSNPPQINGNVVDYAPKMAFESPFLKETWDSGIVYIQKGNRKEVLDFNNF